MSMTITRAAYEQMVAEDLAWLRRQPDSLENAHVQHIVADSVAVYYPPTVEEIPMTPQTIVAQLVIQSEGPYQDLGQRWSLNLIVAGKPHRIGPLVNGADMQEAAAKFAIALGAGIP